MEEARSMTINKMNIINNFFSRSTFRHCIDSGQDNTYNQVVNKYIEFSEGKRNLDLVSEIYVELKNTHRNEYFYKNTLLNKLLLGVHSINTTTALTEVSIANSKADFVLINGKSVVYEIKTELDNLDRLENQINDYYKVFDHVVIVTYKENVDTIEKKLKDIKKPVGIFVLQKDGRLTRVKNPEEYKNDLDKKMIYKILRKAEYEEILLKYYKCLPETTDFKYYSTCRNLFLDIPVETVYFEVLKVLKKRTKVIGEEFMKVPYELKFLAYFMDLKKKDYCKLNIFLNTPYRGR